MDGCGWNICNPGLNCVSHASKCLLCFTIIHLIIHISQIHTLQISHLLNSLQNRQAGGWVGGCVLLQGQRGTEDWSEGRRWRGTTPTFEHSSSQLPFVACTTAFYVRSFYVCFLRHPRLCWTSLPTLLSTCVSSHFWAFLLHQLPFVGLCSYLWFLWSFCMCFLRLPLLSIPPLSLAPLISMFFLCVFPQIEVDKIVLIASN